jgi:hypothetical protein
MYKVIKFFTDIQDNNRPYNVGDVFPHTECGYEVTGKRFVELATRNNLQRTPLIRYVEEPVEEAPKKPNTKRAKKTADK